MQPIHSKLWLRLYNDMTPILFVMGVMGLWMVMVLVFTNGIVVAQGSEAPGNKIQAAWDRLYEESGEAPLTSQTAESTTSPASFNEHVTLNLGGTYRYNAVDFSGKPTVSRVVDQDPPQMVTPDGFSFPQVFESDDHQLTAYGAIGTQGLGHERVNTYVSTMLRQDLDGRTAGSPFQSLLDDHGGERLDLSNAFIELNGLTASGAPASMTIRLGRQFIPDLQGGLLGSPVIDGGRFTYGDGQTGLTLFVGHWVPFYQDVSGVLITGGRVSHELLTEPTAAIGLAPYIDYVYFRDTEHDRDTYRATFGLTGRWQAFDGEADFLLIDGDPIELNLRASGVLGKFSVYSHFRKRLSDDDFTFDLFLTADELGRRQRLNLGRLARATEVRLDADYSLLSWLVVGVGVWLHALDDSGDQTGFNADFQEFSGRLVISPPGPYSGTLQYRYRHVDRGSNDRVTLFDDTSRSGETEYHELNAELRYRWRDRLRVLVGGYYGVYDTQSRLTHLDNTVVTGAYARTNIRVTKAIRLHVLVGADKGNDEFHPDIDYQYTARAGINISY